MHPDLSFSCAVEQQLNDTTEDLCSILKCEGGFVCEEDQNDEPEESKFGALCYSLCEFANCAEKYGVCYLSNDLSETYCG